MINDIGFWGDKKYGKTIMNTLKMLGAMNTDRFDGRNPSNVYVLSNKEVIIYTKYDLEKLGDIVLFTMEDFEKLYPFDVGDTVFCEGEKKTISFMRWDRTYKMVFYHLEGETYEYSASCFTTLKDEQCGTVSSTHEGLSMVSVDGGVRLIIGKNYKLIEENGEYFLVEKFRDFPKTYEKCYELLFNNRNSNVYAEIDDCVACEEMEDIHTEFMKLHICRNAYWKVLRDWKPGKVNNINVNYYYVITRNKNNELIVDKTLYPNKFLVFPTREIAELFLKTFEIIINNCKDLYVI